MSIRRAYRQICEREQLIPDPAQQEIVDALQQLQERLLQAHGGWRGRLRRMLPAALRRQAPRGLYLWGGVGRGKTLLMDLFHGSLATPRKRRNHFHRLMSDVHRAVRRLGQASDPLDRVAQDMARDCDVLCFDEFFVIDIGDAMILSRLLEGLLRRGVTLVATSNVAPHALYRDGLQRDRFLPAIALLEEHTRVLQLQGDTDYRLRLMQEAGTFLAPPGVRAERTLAHFFHDSARAEPVEDGPIEVLGRHIETRGSAPGVAWFDFRALCDGPRSQQDYIELARRYQTIIVSDIPLLTAETDDAARRFISMVDQFYDRRVKLIASAAAPIERLYRGRRLAFEFRRSASRLSEMQTADYLHSAHRP